MKLKTFKQLNQEQRVKIYHLYENKTPIRKIAKIIGVHHTTIYRELDRNSIDIGCGVYKYKPIHPQNKCINRRLSANKNHVKLISNSSLRSKIYSILSDKSKFRGPDEIVGRLRLEGRCPCVCTSFASIRCSS